METKTITRTFLPPGGTLNVELYGGTLTNDSAYPITVEGASVGPGGSIALTPGDSSVNVLCAQPAQVTVVYTSNGSQAASIGSVNIGSPVQIGTNAPALALFRLLCSTALTFGVTYYDVDGKQVGNSTTLAVAAAGGTPVALPSLPAGAIQAVLTHTNPSSVTLFYAVTDSSSIVADFQANYPRYPSRLALSNGVRFGA